ncbi:MAG: response regulator [Imperialibacter sp.]|uniref:response regulator n=1 Tax=Imperialibacter sp. TaxID=2038411 RepID=UPI003A84F817
MNKVKNLFLVDDDDIYTYLTTATIKETSLVEVIKVFGNGQEAIDFLTENKNNPDSLPDVIFLDLAMPIMDGWGFLEEFIELHPFIGKKIEIYVCTSSISPDDLEKVKRITLVSDYIIKPLSQEILVKLIGKLNS